MFEDPRVHRTAMCMASLNKDGDSARGIKWLWTSQNLRLQV